MIFRVCRDAASQGNEAALRFIDGWVFGRIVAIPPVKPGPPNQPGQAQDGSGFAAESTA